MSSSRTGHTEKISRLSLHWGTSRHTRALDVPDDGTGCVVHELDADLGDTTTRTCLFEHISMARGKGPDRGPGAHRFCRGHG